MGLRQVNGDVALASEARQDGTYTSGSVTAGGAASHALLLIHCTEASGTDPTLDASLEQSGDGETWEAVPSSAISTLVGAGNTTANAVVTDDYVRVTTTVAGSFTFTAAVMVFSE